MGKALCHFSSIRKPQMPWEFAQTSSLYEVLPGFFPLFLSAFPGYQSSWGENREKRRPFWDEMKSNRKEVNHRLLKCCLNKSHCVWGVGCSHPLLVNEPAGVAFLEAFWQYISKAFQIPLVPSITILAEFSKRSYMNVNKDLPTGLYITVYFVTVENWKQPVSEMCP